MSLAPGNDAAAMRDTALLRVVVIDDQVEELGYKDILSMMNFDVQIATNGHRGLQLVATTVPDIVLLDSNMPGMNGLEVARRLRADSVSANIPIIMVSVSDDSEHTKAALAIGIDAYVTKPLDIDALERKIIHLTRAKPLTPEQRRQRTETHIGTLYDKPPEAIMATLATKPPRTWGAAMALALKSRKLHVRGRALIALASWQKRDEKLYSGTPAQDFFWKHVRHSLASSIPADAERRWGRLAPVALALMKRDPAEINQRLRNCLTQDAWECRAWALRLLLINQDDTCGELAARAMQDDSGEVRTTAAHVLAEAGSVRHVPLLARAMSDTEPGVRENAALALARVGGELGAEALTTVLLENRSGAAEAAAAALGMLGTEKAVDALVLAADQREEPAVLRQVAYALHRINTGRCRKALHRLANHADDGVRRAANQPQPD